MFASVITRHHILPPIMTKQQSYSAASDHTGTAQNPVNNYLFKLSVSQKVFLKMYKLTTQHIDEMGVKCGCDSSSLYFIK